MGDRLTSTRGYSLPKVLDRPSVAFLLSALATAGAGVCAGEMLIWFRGGAWPSHDAIAFWLAGQHLVEGAPVYGGDPVFLAFRYAPPWAVVLAALSWLDPYLFVILLLGAQVLALRYVTGSWRVAGLVAWLPIVPIELASGNVDILMAAVVLASLRDRPGSGAPAALFALAKFSPVLVVRRWREAIAAGVVLLLITLPWLHLWPEWWTRLLSTPSTLPTWLPLLPRVPVIVVLMAVRRRWATAAAAGLATPAFYFHSLVLLLPAVRIALEDRAMARTGDHPAVAGARAGVADAGAEGE